MARAPLKKDEEVKEFNRQAWNQRVVEGDRWTVPSSPEIIAEARKGVTPILLSPVIPVPAEWLGKLIPTRSILCLASGGGQQGPILAAAGASVTVVDASDKQLEQDKLVADREGLKMNLIRTTADNLVGVEDNSMDLIINPCSNSYFPALAPVWKECARVLKPGGELIFCAANPILFTFDDDEHAPKLMKFPIPVVCQPDPSDPSDAVEFSHTLTDQIGLLCKNGFVVVDLFEDYWSTDKSNGWDKFFPSFINIRARKI